VIETISLSGVNSYLLTAEHGFLLIDTGTPEKRSALDARLSAAGCRPGDLKLVLLTHGDYDHAGNAAFLREKYGAAVALHAGDVGRVETGDWNLGMKPKPDKFALLFRIVSRFIKPGPFDVFAPDVLLEDGQSLRDYGLDATVLHLPGHTRGSTGVVTAAGDLFCGDLMDSMLGRPSLQFFIDDMTAATSSLSRVRPLATGMVYPGHGRPFKLDRVV
jgi:hydroxyacylglutathione hydrolase